MAPPKKGKKSEGFHAAAGLIRYFDAEEETAIKIDPKIIIAVGAAAAVAIYVLNAIWPV